MYQQLGTFFADPVGNSVKIVEAFLTNPSQALVLYGPLLFAVAFQAFSWVGASILYPSLLLAPFLGLVLPVTLALANALSAFPPLLEPAAAGIAISAQPAVSAVPVAGPASTLASPAPAPASAGAVGAPAPAAAPVGTTASFAYVVGGGRDPGPVLGPTVGPRGGIKAPAATIPAVGAAAASRAQSRTRRRRRSTMREHGDAFLDMDSDIAALPDNHGFDVESDYAASENGAGTLGFAGTVHKESVLAAAGLTKLAGDEFGGGPRMPMVPATWDQGSEGPGRGGTGG
jgi:PPE-repeat protein